MSTTLHIPPERPLQFCPGPPPLDGDPQQTRVLEIGPGKGEFLLHLAKENPRVHYIGLELKRRRFEKIAKQALALELNNLFMVRGDARECLPRIFGPEILDRIYILFPDPWPKLRHAKHRLINTLIISKLHTILKKTGEVFCATDAGYYSAQIVAAFEQGGGFECQAIESPYPTYFEKKWKGLGRAIDYWRFFKIPLPHRTASGTE